ncbi:MAG: glycoside hydrolase family 3 N-terminal domain-containing protein, partial [Bacteroidota bacterium]
MYRFFTTCFLLIGLSVSATAQQNVTPTSPDEQRIEELLAQMTLAEKVGQMTQLNLSVFYKDKELQRDTLRAYLVDHHVGSILNLAYRYLSLEEWIELQTIIQEVAQESRLKIPVIYGIDAIHGMSYTQEATLFPHNIGLAATRNADLVYQCAAVTAKETRASGIRWNFDPVVGVGRNPIWPRFEETYGEDTYLVSTLGSAAIRAYEGEDLTQPDRVASCMKHYLGYTVPASGKDRSPAYLPEIVLREHFLPPFAAAVAAGTSTVMLNSGAINGVPVHVSKYLVTDVLKEELGFDGVVVTDWLDIVYLYTQHGVAKDNREAVKLAINAGVDMSMVPFDLSFCEDLIDLVEVGEVSTERIDDAVRRILKLKMKVGLFDQPYPEPAAAANFGRAAYQDLALRVARESITLLKNDTIQNIPALPLVKDSRILITGPAARSVSTLHGSWSYSWDGRQEELYPASTQTIAAAITEKVGADRVVCEVPTGFHTVTAEQIAALPELAADVDVIVLCLGEQSYAEHAGNVDQLTLPDDQRQLAMAAIETGKPVILVLSQGRPLIMEGVVAGSAGVLLAYRPASAGAEALAEVLFGDYNPNGRLPYSYPRRTGNIIPYDAPVRAERYYNPQWPFGYGLSYTSFSYGDLRLSSYELTREQPITVTVTVSNAGDRNGAVAVDLYTRDKVASITPAMRKLRAFQKVELAPGEAKTLQFELTLDDLSFVNTQLARVTEAGEFEVQIGDQRAVFA